MRCSQAILLIEKDIRGRIPKDKKERLAIHLEKCQECRDYQTLRREMLVVLNELTKRRK